MAAGIVVPLMDHLIRIDRDSLTLACASADASFPLFAKRAEKKYGAHGRRQEAMVETRHAKVRQAAA